MRYFIWAVVSLGVADASIPCGLTSECCQSWTTSHWSCTWGQNCETHDGTVSIEEVGDAYAIFCRWDDGNFDIHATSDTVLQANSSHALGHDIHSGQKGVATDAEQLKIGTLVQVKRMIEEVGFQVVYNNQTVLLATQSCRNIEKMYDTSRCC